MNNRWIKLLALTAILSAACSDALADMRGEYFWNDDPGVGRATALTLPDGDADGYRRADIATAGMHEGLNMLGVRVCNGKRWSVTQQAMVWYRPAGDPAVTAAEYYWNDDPGVGQATAIAAPAVDGAGQMQLALSATGMHEGLNMLGVRVKTGSRWSVTQQAMVWQRTAAPSTITAAEYFWNDDPGVGNGIQLPELCGEANAATARQIELQADGLAKGENTLGLRVRSGGRWSVTHTARVVVRDETPVLIVGLEYFWGDDPGMGKATAVDVTPATEVEIDPLTVDFPEEEADEYTLSMRPMTDTGYGPTYSWTRKNVPLTDIAIDPTEIALGVGQAAQLGVTPTPADALHRDCTWSSDDPAIATVDANGVVAAIARGETTVRAVSVRYPDITAECRVTVNDEQSALDLATLGVVTVETAPGEITVTGDIATEVSIYNAIGIRVARLDPAPTVTARVTPGVYLIRVNNTTRKVSVK